MKKIFAALNGILVAAVLIGDYFYSQCGGLRLKGMVSAGFVMIGAVNLVFALLSKKVEKRYPLTMLAGLVFAMLGDIWLGIRFETGVCLFGLGHVMYSASFCLLKKTKLRDLLPMSVLMTVSVLVLKLTPSIRMAGDLEKLLIGYALIISAMVGKAFSNLLRERNGLNVVLVVGSVLFYFSDLMLALDMFGGAPPITGTLCLATYYPGQCVLAYSVYRYVVQEHRCECIRTKEMQEVAE